MILTKDQLKYLTREITPEESQYVAQVSQIYAKSAEYGTCGSEEHDEVKDLVILAVNKFKAYAIKFDEVATANGVDTYNSIGDLARSVKYYINDMVDSILPTIRYIFNIDTDYQIYSNLTLPVGLDPYELINEVKEMVFELINYLKSRNDLFDDLQVLRLKFEDMSKIICDYCYKLRLAK